MRSKWITLAAVVSLAALASVCGVRAQDQTSSDQPSNDRAASASAPSAVTDSAERRHAQELLRKAIAEIDANHFDAARRLVSQAAATGVVFGLFDIRPEHVLAEIERREANGGSSHNRIPKQTAAAALPQKPLADGATLSAGTRSDTDVFDTSTPSVPASPKANLSDAKAPNVSLSDPAGSNNKVLDITPSELREFGQPSPPTQAMASHPQGTNHSQGTVKTRAIELLDRGLLALDEKRFDDAARFALEAAKLRVVWERYDYQPDNLLEEIREQRAKMGAAARPDLALPNTSQVTQSNDPAPLAPAVPARRIAASDASVTPPAAFAEPPAQQTVAASNDRLNRPANPNPVAQLDQPGLATNVPNHAGPDRAQMLLERAIGDLQDGHDELARQRIERALGLLRGTGQTPGTELASGASVPGTPQQVMLYPAIPPAAVNTPSASPAYFPRQSPTTVTTAQGGEMLKPLHDPYLGDEPYDTRKSSPGEQTFRVATPQPADLASLPPYHPRSTVTNDSAVRQTSYQSDTPAAAAAYPPVQSLPDGPTSLSQKADWLEKNSVPLGPDGRPWVPPQATAAGYAGQTPAPGSASMAPSQPVPDNRWSSTGRTVYAPPPDTTSATSSDQQQPGFFRKMWSAMWGQ